jgi:hypothetical protein
MKRQSGKPCESGCEELEWTSTAEAFLRLQSWQKCTERDEDSAEK